MDSRPYCFQTGHPLGFAVQLRLTPELKQALISAQASGDAVSLRFREHPHREAVLSIAGQEHLFSTAPQAGQVEVVEIASKSKGAASVAAVKQRLTLQRGLDTDGGRPRGLTGSRAGGMPEDRKKRSAVLLGGSQRGPGLQPRVTTTTEVATRTTPQSGTVALGTTGRASANGMVPLAGGSLRPTHGSSAPTGPRVGAGGTDGPPRKPMELPKPRSLQPGGMAPKPQPGKPRKAPTPPPPETAIPTGVQQDGPAPPPRTGGGGSGGGSASGGGSGSSPVGYGAAAGGGGGSGGGSAAAGPSPSLAPAAVAAELPRTAVLAARRGDLPLVVAALLREQPLTSSSLQSRIDAAYRVAGVKPEAREYVKRVMDNCCAMSANRMQLKPDVLSREGPRLDEMVSGTSPTNDTPFAAAGTGAAVGSAGLGAGRIGRSGPTQGGGSLKRVASCSPDPRLSPDQDPSPGAGGPGARSMDNAAISGGTVEEDEGGNLHTHQDSQRQQQHPQQQGAAGMSARPAAGRHGPAAAKRHKMSGGHSSVAGGAGGGTQQQLPPRQGALPAAGRGSGGSGLQGYDDFDDLADPPPAPSAAAPPTARESSAGRAPVGPGQLAGRAAVARATAAKRPPPAPASGAPLLSSGGPRGLPSFAALPSVAAANSDGGGSQPAVQQQSSPPRPQPSKPPALGAISANLRPAGRAMTPATGSGKDTQATVSAGGGGGGGGPRAGSVSPTAAHTHAASAPPAAPPAPPAGPVGTSAAAASTRPVVTSYNVAAAAPAAAAGAAAAASVRSAGGPVVGMPRMPRVTSESRMDTDGGRGTTSITTGGGGGGGAGPASPDCESTLDPEIQAYADVQLQDEDKDADWYRSYVDWKPEPHAAVQSYEQYEQYEREYCTKFEVYHRLNQKYNEVVREADAQRVAVDAALGAEERHRCVLALWRLGASKWRLLEAWKRARHNLHTDLGDLRSRVAEYVAAQQRHQARQTQQGAGMGSQ